MFPRNLHVLSSLLVLQVFSLGTVNAEVYKCQGDAGSVTLSNIEKGQNCTKMVLPPPESKKSAAARAKTEAPKEVKAPEKPKSGYEAAASERKRVIQEEIDLEKSRLNTVQVRIKELAAVSNRTPDQVKELVALQQKESMHTSNIQLLSKEINR